MKSTLLNPLILLLLSFISFTTGCAVLGGGGSEIRRANDYQLSAPRQWQRRGSDGESDEAYQLPSGNTVTVTSSCNKHKEASLRVLTKELLIGSRNIKIEREEELVVSGSEALYSRVRASSEGVPFLLDIVVVKKRGCVFDFSLMSPKAISAQETKDFLTFVKSLKYATD
ncbi:MAG: hypothetical protein EBQ85_02860 [Proteobacteria bacterium]|nr:hypothetical protein [Pseudomonadota bacterium]